MTGILQEIMKMSLEERILLVERIWDDIADDPKLENMKFSEEFEQELDNRWKLVEQDKTKLHTWDQTQSIILPGK
jgi:putative addiction module component (TIGR02574 family)